LSGVWLGLNLLSQFGFSCTAACSPQYFHKEILYVIVIRRTQSDGFARKRWRKCANFLAFHGLALALGQRRHILSSYAGLIYIIHDRQGDK
jgi:hypothetical protein